MGTLNDVLTLTRVRIKDRYKNEFPDSELILMVGEVMDQVYDDLCNMESNLVIQDTTFTTVSGVDEYVLSDIGQIVHGSLWIDSTTPLELKVLPSNYVEPSYPLYYSLLPDSKIKLTATPDDAYQISLSYCNLYTKPTLADLATYNFPWEGIWDKAIARTLVVECLTILERGVGVAAAQASNAWDYAANETYKRGTVRRMIKGNLS